MLHRRLPPPPGGASGPPVFVYDPRRGGGLPQELQRDGQALPAPETGAQPEPGEVIYARDGSTAPEMPDGSEAAAGAPPDGAAPDGAPPEGVAPAPGEVSPFGERMDPRQGLGSRALPDRDTEKEGTLGYHAVFDPSVVPFKRNRALDVVSPDGSLALGTPRLEVVRPVGNHGSADREVFWGSVLVDGRPGQDIPLPSVAPSARILSYETTPRTALTFVRDQAGNFYVRTTVPGRFRLIFLTDAPSSYFGRSVPLGHTVRDVPSELRPRLPSEYAGRALAVASRLGLDPSMPYDRLVGALVRHFRDFEPGDPPPESDDIYTDLALGKRGICRHRAYAFVVTAQGLGIPARYVFNEAHVFVEVWIPGRDAGWLRVDLGGGAERLVIRGTEDKLRHRPRGRDPFERPEPYVRALAEGQSSAGASTIEGLPPVRRRERAPASGSATTGDPLAGAALLPPPVARREARNDLLATRTSLTLSESLVFRGDPLEGSGRVVDADGHPVTIGSVQLLLVDGPGGRALGLLALTALDAAGRFRTSFTVPPDQRPGGYEVVAEFLGADPYAASRSP
ncbi:MAG: transglutaminase domain-containing protein [Deltaproteobacteria bacterium]|nr:transglutaminase domain-containing protein [Deltaproteobacteria bacterium]MCB9788467.1 transglutaminase domain-containing protein [Deltaproteobacteria bacterium]